MMSAETTLNTIPAKILQEATTGLFIIFEEPKSSQDLKEQVVKFFPNADHFECQPRTITRYPCWHWETDDSIYFCSGGIGGIVDLGNIIAGCTLPLQIPLGRNANQTMSLPI